MSTSADRVRANAAKVSSRRRQQTTGPAAEAEAPAAARTTPKVSTRRVRRTVDLTQNRHRELDRWAGDKADELSLTRVTSQDVLSALVDELLTNPAVAEAVGERIRQARS